MLLYFSYFWSQVLSGTFCKYGCSFIRIETVFVSNVIQPSFISLSAVHFLEFEIQTFNERSSTKGLGKLSFYKNQLQKNIILAYNIFFNYSSYIVIKSYKKLVILE